MQEFTVAFAGNPNVGKTALINALAGTKLKVGNWPGVTVEKKEAELIYNGKKIKLIDLPGVYSLSPYTIEERVTRNFLLKEKADLVVNVIDSTNLERNLYLTVQLMEMEVPMLIALNMWDEFLDLGYKLDLEKFQNLLGIKAIPTAAVKGKGVKDLLDAIDEAVQLKQKVQSPQYSPSVEKFISKVMNILPSDISYPRRWTAIKLLEGDSELIKEFSYLEPKLQNILKDFEATFDAPGEDVIPEERYGFVSAVVKQTLKRTFKEKRTLTDILDAIFLNRYLGIPIFLFILYIVFKLTFDGSAPFIEWIDGFVNGFLAKWVKNLISFAPTWFQSLVINGIIGGVGTVLTFVPLLIFLYFFLAILEESGYMARAAFVMDRVMRAVGLHGKSFVPMIVGFGCNVPAIYATRTLENEQDRKLTALLIPFMSCGARLPIYVLFTSVFFKKYQAEVVLSMYVIGVLVAIFIGYLLKRTLYKSETPPFVMELPPYRIPTFKLIWTSISTRISAFLKKAATVVVTAMVVLWALVNIPYGVKPENTILGRFATTISPLFKPCGFDDWRAVAALIPGTMAKEAVVGALGTLYGVEKENKKQTLEKSSFIKDLKDQIKGFFKACIESIKAMFSSLKPGVFEIGNEAETVLQKAIKNSFTPLSAFCYMVFCLLWIPCIVTLGAIYQEFGKRLLFASLCLNTVTPYFVSTVIHLLGKLLGFK